MRMSDLRIVTESPPTPPSLHDYARVPIAFDVTGRFDPSSGQVVPVARAFVKDYDACRGNHPTEWPQRWDLSRWWFAAAFVGDRRVGGAVVVPYAGDVEGDDVAAPDAALLWDIRVAPDVRRLGVGRALLAFAECHACAAGRSRMLVETQDVNVAACRFYARERYTLLRVEPRAYPTLPDETRLIWQKPVRLSPVTTGGEIPPAAQT